MQIYPNNIKADKAILATFRVLAEVAAEVPLRYFGKEVATHIKSDNTPATEADLATEQAMRQVITEAHPDHGIVGEEYEAHNPNSDGQWIIDPIDGTKSFICGMPLFGSLVGFMQDGEMILGMLVMPVLKQVFFGCDNGKEQGAWCNGEPISTEACGDLSQARFSIGEGNKFCQAYPDAARILSPRLSMLRFYHDCYAFALLARGGLHGVIEMGLQAYDILPLVPLIKGAGGCVSDWRGAPLTRDFDGTVLACADEALQAQALELLQQEFLT